MTSSLRIPIKYFILVSLISLTCNSLMALNTPILRLPLNGSNNILGGVQIKWDAVSSSTQYQCQVDTSALFNSGALRTLNMPSPSGGDTLFTLTDLYYGKIHYWKIRAMNSSDTSAWSSSWSFTVTINSPLLNLPANAATNIPGGVLLDWNAHTYVKSYDIQVDTISSFTSPIVRNINQTYIDTASTDTDTEYILGDLYFGKQYFWRVRSKNNTGSSNWSSTRSFTVTSLSPVLVSPTNNSLNIPGGVSIDWKAHLYVSFYDYMVDTVASFNSPGLIQGSNPYTSTLNTGTDSKFDLSDLIYGKKYFWKVRSRNAVDTSPWSATWSFTVTTDGPIIASPLTGSTNIKAGITLDWDAHWFVKFYDYQLDTTPSFNSPVMVMGIKSWTSNTNNGVDTRVTVTDLYYGKTYYWRIRSRNANGASNWTNASFTVATSLDISGPANGATNFQGAPNLDWDAHNTVLGYMYEHDTVPTFSSSKFAKGTLSYISFVNDGNDTKLTINNFYYGRTYYWRVRSYHLKDTSAWTAVQTVHITPTGPVQVSPLHGTLNVGTTNIMLDWNAQFSVSSYILDVDVNNQFNTPNLIRFVKVYQNTNSGNGDTQQSISPLQPNTVYYWRVRSFNTVDSSSWSSVWAFSTGSSPIIIPSTPTHKTPSTASVNMTVPVLIDWDAIADITFYDLEYDTVATFNSPHKSLVTKNYISAASNGTDTEHLATNLLYNKTYHWRVRTRTTSSSSAWSQPWTFSTEALFIPAIPIQISPINNTQNTPLSVMINWNAVQGADYYDYEADTVPAFNSLWLKTGTHNFISSSHNNPDTEFLLSTLDYEQKYYWRVRSRTQLASSAWSNTWTFTCQSVSSPGTPIQVSPVHLSIGNPLTLKLDWNAVPDIDFYDYQVDTVSSFNSNWLITGAHGFISNNSGNPDTEFQLSALEHNKTYFWKVRTRTTLATSPWSSVWSFTTELATGVNEPVKLNASAWRIYPNPANAFVEIKFVDAMSTISKISLMTIHGKVSGELVMVDEPHQTNHQRIDTSNIPDGVYFLVIETGGSRHFEKLIIKR
jgi:hypothetical protein